MASVLPGALLASLLLLAPVAPGADAPGAPPGSVMFTISAEQADRIIRQALTREFPDSVLQPVSPPAPGFAAPGRYAIHSYTVSAHRLPAVGRLADGSLVEGFRFDVRTSGTMPRSVRTAALRVAADMERRASLLAPGRPAVGGAAQDFRRAALDGRQVPDWLVLLALVLGLVIGLATGSRLSSLAPPARSRAWTSPERGSRPVREQADEPSWNFGLLDMTHDAVIVWEMEGAGILYWNHAAEQLYGFEREDVQGKVTHDVLRTELAGSVNDLERQLARYGVWVGELIHTRRDGVRITVEGRLALLSKRDGRWLVLEVNRDLTDRNRAAAARSAMEDRMIRLRRPNAEQIG